MRLALTAALSIAAAFLGAGAVNSQTRSDPPAGAPVLEIPLACKYGEDCWIGAYYDENRGPGLTDFLCGTFTYEQHNGTDFMVRDRARISEGVPVLASAPGRVRGVRDEMQDVDVSIAGPDSVKGRECGNAVVVENGNGWETQYCHMRRGSVAVKPGDQIKTGDTLGLVGMSGLSSYPHVHLSVRKDGKDVDPFYGRPDAPACGTRERGEATPLWSKAARVALGYGAGSIFNVGVAAEQPSLSKVVSGSLRGTVVPKDAPLVASWMQVQGVSKGDRYRMAILDPAGRVFVEQSDTSKDDKINNFQLIGRKMPPGGFSPGHYRAEFRWTRARDGHEDARTLDFDVTP